ncbi:MAG TPA: VanZ family protein [Vicinamibacterales bacterium]
MSPSISRWWLWLPVVLYMAFIFGLSSIPNTPDLPGGSDKGLHALLYAGLGVLLVRALAGGLLRRITLAMALATTVIGGVYGVSDEFHQHFVPPRQVEALDVVADTTGAGAAAFALLGWSFARRGRMAPGERL